MATSKNTHCGGSGSRRGDATRSEQRQVWGVKQSRRTRRRDQRRERSAAQPQRQIIIIDRQRQTCWLARREGRNRRPRAVSHSSQEGLCYSWAEADRLEFRGCLCGKEDERWRMRWLCRLHAATNNGHDIERTSLVGCGGGCGCEAPYRSGCLAIASSEMM